MNLNFVLFTTKHICTCVEQPECGNNGKNSDSDRRFYWKKHDSRRFHPALPHYPISIMSIFIKIYDMPCTKLICVCFLTWNCLCKVLYRASKICQELYVATVFCKNAFFCNSIFLPRKEPRLPLTDLKPCDFEIFFSSFFGCNSSNRINKL